MKDDRSWIISDGTRPGTYRLGDNLEPGHGFGDTTVYHGGLFRSDLKPAYDITDDGTLNAADIDALFEAGRGDEVNEVVTNHLWTTQGDANLDGKVDFADFLRLSESFGQNGSWADGDFDGSGLVDMADFTLLSANFNL